MKLRDFTVILVIVFSAVTGIGLPVAAPFFAPLMLYGVMMSLFISFIPLDFKVLVRIVWQRKGAIIWYAIAHQLIFPSLSYLLFQLIAPDYAFAALLLTGTAVGASAPFMAYLMGANVGFVTVLTVTTSFLLPFSLPLTVQFWGGTTIDISLIDMMLTLARMILIPAFIAFIVQRFVPAFAQTVIRYGYILGMAAMYISMTAVFFRYAPELTSSYQLVKEGLIVSFIASFLLILFGWLSGLFYSPDIRQLYVISSVFINSVVVIVISAQFFGHREAISAICYSFAPYYLLFPLLRFYVVHTGKKEAH